MPKENEEINKAFDEAIGQPIRFTLDHLPAALEEVIAIATGRLLLSHFKIQGVSPDTIVAFLLRGYKWYHQVKDGTLDHLSESYQVRPPFSYLSSLAKSKTQELKPGIN